MGDIEGLKHHENMQKQRYKHLKALFIHSCSSVTRASHTKNVIPTGLPRSGKKFWKMKNFPGQGKVRELHFQSGKFKKNEKSHGKVREFQNFPKKMLVNRLLEILVSIICKQY